MPPMANGGKQRGVYGRAESPYNADYLTATFGSGSSNGSGTSCSCAPLGPLWTVQFVLRYGLFAGGPTSVGVLPWVWSTRTAPSHWLPSV